jgi:hypothetical protein
MLLVIKSSPGYSLNDLENYMTRFMCCDFLNDENECTKEFLITKYFANVKIQRLFWGKNG